jgi:hypothetical protein
VFGRQCDRPKELEDELKQQSLQKTLFRIVMNDLRSLPFKLAVANDIPQTKGHSWKQVLQQFYDTVS